MASTETRSGLGPYVDALYAGDRVALRRILSDADGYLQTLVNNATSEAADAASSAAASADSATASATSAAASADSESQSQVLYTKINALMVSFSRVWYGTLPSDPTADPNGNPPINGAGYFNSTEEKIRIYDGSKWNDYDEEAEQLTQQAAVSAAYSAQSAAAASASATSAAASATTSANYADKIVPIYNQLNALFPPLKAGYYPQVNAAGDAYQMTDLSTIYVPLAGNCTIAGQVTFSSNITVNGTMYGTATSALYGDLAEHYITRRRYRPGTIVSLKSTLSKLSRKAYEVEAAVSESPYIGVVSTRPGVTINAQLTAGQKIGIIGRVPTRVIGVVNVGDPISLSDTPGVGIVGRGEIIGHAITPSDDDGEKLIEVALFGGVR